ncbi:MAG: helix-turn-helix transcriptional regulator [Armatimonadetes bacterium]|nr:helix-turn-helix transcriptional regulator [Armatimonadota bacterium]
MDIRCLRQLKRFSLRELARLAGTSATHLSRIERGLARLTPALGESLEEALGISPGSLRTSRPEPALERKYDLGRLFGHLPRTEPVGTLRVAYREALYREPGPSLLRELDRQARPPAFWRAAKLLPRQCNGPEQTLLLHLLTPAAEIQVVHPHTLGLACPVVQAPGRKWLAVVLKTPDLLTAVMPQVTIETRPASHPRLDFLAAVLVAGQRTLVDLELDGPYHEGWRDRKRDEDARKAGLAPLRFPVEEVYRRDFLARLWGRLGTLAEAA